MLFIRSNVFTLREEEDESKPFIWVLSRLNTGKISYNLGLVSGCFKY